VNTTHQVTTLPGPGPAGFPVDAQGATHFGLADRMVPDHGVGPAERLDGSSPFPPFGTGMHGQRAWDSHKKDLDFLTLYFPGPDNVAHHVGAMTGNPTGPGPAGFPVGALGDTTNPLPAIAEQVRRVTDRALGRVLTRIERDGYLNACLFVLVADHGLIAYRNTDPFNLMSADAGGRNPPWRHP
jgi:predicted AlkP superfamily pyrophosphatase or phosphodiesterase